VQTPKTATPVTALSFFFSLLLLPSQRPNAPTLHHHCIAHLLSKSALIFMLFPLSISWLLSLAYHPSCFRPPTSARALSFSSSLLSSTTPSLLCNVVINRAASAEHTRCTRVHTPRDVHARVSFVGDFFLDTKLPRPSSVSSDHSHNALQRLPFLYCPSTIKLHSFRLLSAT
jgi:hypothetical protein